MPALSIIVPTYNERENIPSLVEAVCHALPDFELIFVDDASPDGTAGVIHQLCCSDHRVKLIVREGKLGLGSAVLRGLEEASGEYIAMMDADLSHRPADLARMMEAIGGADIAVGSRYVEGSRVVGWPLGRYITSRGAALLARLMLPLPVKDVTSGFALFRRSALEAVERNLSPQGFKLLLEILAKAPHLKVVEVPITFVERQHGLSKMNTTEVKTFLRLCWELRRQHKKQGAWP